MQQAARLQLVHVSVHIPHVEHICAAHLDLANPFFYKAPQAVDVLAVIQFNRLLAHVGALVAGQVEDGLDHLRHGVVRVHRQQANVLAIVNGHARVRSAKVNANA